VAAKDYVYGVKGPARVANQYKWTALKMKIKKIIKEELQKILKEQSGEELAAIAKADREGWDEVTDKPTKIVGKVDGGLARVQRQLRRIGALDYEQRPIKVDGKPGPRTATALASVTTLPCIGGKYCEGTSKFLKNKNLQRAAAAMLKRKDKMTPEQSADKVVAALNQKIKPGAREMKRALAMVDDAMRGGLDPAKGTATPAGPAKPETEEDKNVAAMKSIRDAAKEQTKTGKVVPIR